MDYEVALVLFETWLLVWATLDEICEANCQRQQLKLQNNIIERSDLKETQGLIYMKVNCSSKLYENG